MLLGFQGKKNDLLNVRLGCNFTKMTHRSVEHRDQEEINVLMLGVDSVSRLSFLRHAPDLHRSVSRHREVSFRSLRGLLFFRGKITLDAMEGKYCSCTKMDGDRLHGLWFPCLYRFITNTLGGVPLYGYNKVGDNTKPNVIPLLTGLFYEQVVGQLLEYLDGGAYHDNLPFLWWAALTIVFYSPPCSLFSWSSNVSSLEKKHLFVHRKTIPRLFGGEWPFS